MGYIVTWYFCKVFRVFFCYRININFINNFLWLNEFFALLKKRLCKRKRQKQPPELFSKKKVFLAISQNSQENACARVSFLKEILAQVFSCEFCEVSTNIFLQNTSERLLLKKVSHQHQLIKFLIQLECFLFTMCNGIINSSFSDYKHCFKNAMVEGREIIWTNFYEPHKRVDLVSSNARYRSSHQRCSVKRCS